jgi:hypothetical protein
MKQLYIHKMFRTDGDPDFPMEWTEYRIGTSKDKVPEFEESIERFDGEDALTDAVEFVFRQGAMPVIVN